MKAVETITTEGKLLAIIVRSSFQSDGVNFLTPPNLSQQLAYMRHPAGKTIDPHLHNPVHREVLLTQEVLLIKKGRLRVDFYDDEKAYLQSCVLDSGDVILLASGGHGFGVLEELEMIEVKQGPYTGEQDKTRFNPGSPPSIVIDGEES